MKWQDYVIGAVMLILPFIVFAVMFWYWPAPGGSPLEEWYASTREIVALDKQRTIGQGTLDTAVADQAKSAGATGQAKQTLDERVKTAKDNVSDIEKKIADATGRRDQALKTITADSSTVSVSQEARLCILVVLAGALGATVSAARGFAVHAGNKDYDPAWRWWYLLRIPTGCGIAFILYAVLRAGLVPWKLDDDSKTLDQINPYGFVAIGALGGMFANEAFQKLQAVLAAILSSGSSSTPALQPKIDSVALTQEGDRKGITITGQGFARGASVKVNDKPWKVEPKDVKATEIRASGDEDLPKLPDKIRIELTIPGSPARTLKWEGTVE